MHGAHLCLATQVAGRRRRRRLPSDARALAVLLLRLHARLLLHLLLLLLLLLLLVRASLVVRATWRRSAPLLVRGELLQVVPSSRPGALLGLLELGDRNRLGAAVAGASR
jgi:hypothetical protein